MGSAVTVLRPYKRFHGVEVLRYNPEGPGFDSRWSHWNFSLTSLILLAALRPTQPLRDVSTRVICWGEWRPVREAGNLTIFTCRLS
jgi:hypothetical protein